MDHPQRHRLKQADRDDGPSATCAVVRLRLALRPRNGPLWLFCRGHWSVRARLPEPPVVVRMRRGVSGRNRPFAALTAGRAEIFPGRGPFSGVGCAGCCDGQAVAALFWGPAGKHLARPGSAGGAAPLPLRRVAA